MYRPFLIPFVIKELFQCNTLSPRSVSVSDKISFVAFNSQLCVKYMYPTFIFVISLAKSFFVLQFGAVRIRKNVNNDLQGGSK